MAEIVARDDIHSETSEALRDRLKRALTRTASDLVEMALIVRELEGRGEDLSSLRLGLVDHLRRIAAGQLLPDLVVRFSGFPALLQIASSLALPDQERLAGDKPLPLAVWREGRIEWREVDPLSLTWAQLRQVFAGTRFRSQAEQVSRLEDAATKRVARPRPARSHVRADRERGGLVCGRSFAAHDEVLAALAELAQADYDDEVEGDAPLVVKLSAAELRQIKVRAARTGTTMGRLVRRALVAAGLIGAEASAPDDEVSAS